MTNPEHAETRVLSAAGTSTARPELEERYFRRMAAAVDEKTQLTDWLRGGRVLDIGAGGGELAARIAVLPDIEETIALDDSADAIAHLEQMPGITVRSGSADQLEVLGLRDLDGIVMSSVLHEIASYGPNGPENGRQAVMANLTIIAKALSPGGVLVIRDFVTPARPDRLTTLVTPGHDGDELLSAYLKRVPLPELRRLESLGQHRFVGSARVVTEALLTVNWGAESLPRETQEQYCQFELDELVDAVEALGAGLRLVHREAWVQPGYRQHLAAWSVLEQDGTPWFPETKAIWVFEKAASPLSTRA